LKPAEHPRLSSCRASNRDAMLDGVRQALNLQSSVTTIVIVLAERVPLSRPADAGLRRSGSCAT
jgi:hypothetical protein